MNIVIFSESAYPILNGVSVSTDILLKGLLDKGYNVTLICPENKNSNDDIYPYKIIRTPAFNFIKNYPLPKFNKEIIFSILNQLKPDIIHCQIPFTYALIAKEWAKNHKILFSAFNHTLYTNYLHYASKFLAPIIKKPFISYLKKFYNSCDIVLTPSNMMKKELLKYGVNKNIEIIPTGINLPNPKDFNLTNELKEKYNIPIDKKIVIYLSRIAKEKNVYMLLNSFNEVYNNKQDVFFLVCGSGPEYLNLVNYKDKLECRENIVFTGQVKKSDVYNFLYMGDIFAFPSYTETQGLAVCEAMACGLGVVAVNAGGVPESIIENVNGILTKNNVKDFSNKILYLLNNEEKLNYIRKKAIESSEKFSIDNMINSYIKVFTKYYKELK